MEILHFLIHLMVLYIIPGGIEALFELSNEFDMEETPWSGKTFPRHTEDSCECGQHQHATNGSEPWNVFLHIQTDPSTAPTICIGTIITSNLIATSHECFLYPNRHLNIYDLWKPEGGEKNAVWEARASHVTVSTTVNYSASAGYRFEVEEIIYNPDYAFASAAKVFPPRFDLALVRLKGFNLSSSLHPICIPSYKRALELWNKKEIDHAEAFYYGYDEMARNGSSPERHHGILSDKHEECKTRLRNKYEMKYNFCFQYAYRSGTSPRIAGGPLYVDSGSRNTSFLIGISSIVKSRASRTSPAGIEYGFFTNLLPMVKYIEFMADQHKSTWCKTPSEFTLTRKQVEISRDDDTKRDVYLWELEETANERNENLNCVCGIPNKVIGGRVVGGEEAHPHEFSWMSYIRLHTQGRGNKAVGQCGGTVINDRMVLSAAHCVVQKTKKSGQVITRPEDVDVSIKLHSKHGDSEEVMLGVSAVLFHPEFAYAQKKNYFDYDVAIFVLKEPIAFDSHPVTGFRPICLPKNGPYQNLVGENVIVAGWGLTDPKNRQSAAEKLQMLDLPIIDRKKCSDVTPLKVTKRNLCAGSLNMYKDAAPGDSGGPLMLKRDNQFTEVGIVSWGDDVKIKGKMKTAALYSDVQLLLSFIDYHANRVHANWCKSDPPIPPATATTNPPPPPTSP